MARSGRVGILGSTGARTGKLRSAPLGYVTREDGTVVVGSGRPENRGWVVNLRANPACTFRIKGTERRYRARPLAGEEREAALAELRAKVGSMAERMTWGDVFVLEPEG
jgi:deazaflavin-dependent oxidoreductase (nitroreductase family)